MEYLQNYDPLQNTLLSTLAAAAPVVTLLYLLALHPVRTREGATHLGVAAHWAALAALVVALAVSLIVFRMPGQTAGMSMLYGALYGLFPIGLIIVSAMFLYTITLVSGLFDVVKDSVAVLSDDARVQAILIAFSFGAFVEGAAGFGTPVAISGALLVGLGFRPLQAAVLCLIANTAPVAYGGLGTPIIALSAVTGIDTMPLSQMAARQLPFFSVIVPVWMTAVQVRMDGRPWRDVLAVWPALLVAGGAFGITQFLVGNFLGHMLVDILGGLASMGSLALFLRVWQPQVPYRPGHSATPRAAAAASRDTGVPPVQTASEAGSQDLPQPADTSHGRDARVTSQGSGPAPVLAPAFARAGPAHGRPAHTPGRILLAWLPWAMLTLFVFLWGLKPMKDRLNAVPGALIEWKVTGVQDVVFRTPPVVKEKAPDKAVYLFGWLSATGTGIFVAAILSGLVAGLTAQQWRLAATRTAARLLLPLVTISLILAMGFLTKYSGMDAVLGLAFTHTGWLYPFFAAMLGWLGVALTGSDTSSNIMFGSMQKIAAEQGGFNPVLITTANSTGGVMGKMIDAQSIVVATAACYEDPREGKLAAGPIFRAVLPHSIVLAMLMGVLVMMQAYVWEWMVPGQ